MTERVIIAHESVPRLASHMRLRFDATRSTWTIQAPEKAFILDEIAQTIISQCNGSASVGAIIENLCAAFPDAPYGLIERDVIALLQNFADKGVMHT